MPTANDFQTIQVQASLFTPGLQFRSAKILGHLLTEYGDQFDGEPGTFPPFPIQKGPVPKGAISVRLPQQITLQSQDGHLRLQAAATRLDVIRDGEAIDEAGVASHLSWACELGLRYLKLNEARAGRVACIIHRLCEDTNPAVSLSRHFCKDRWIGGPLNRPSDFELHALKRFRLGDLFEINSWMRFKTAVRQEENTPVFPPNMILVEQDFNSLAEQMESREMSDSEIRGFFELAPREMRHVLEMYLPLEQP